MTFATAHVQRLLRLLQRYPGLLALFGFCSGLASFWLVDRQARVGQLVAVLLLCSWLALLLEGLLSRATLRWLGVQLPPLLLRYLAQLIHQESLFFVLPFLFVSTAWNTGQALFTGLLGLCALLAIIDPLYFRWLARRRGLYLAYHALSLFAVLLTTLPLIWQLSSHDSYRLALGLALVLALPSLFGVLRPRRIWQGLLLVLLLLALAAAGWLLQRWIPPATLWISDMALSEQIRQRQPVQRLQTLDAGRLRQQGIYAFTAINAPRGLHERIYHQWYHQGQLVDRIALEIRGGRGQGYRAWSHKMRFPSQPQGAWTVRVLTEGGQQLGVLRFDVR